MYIATIIQRAIDKLYPSTKRASPSGNRISYTDAYNDEQYPSIIVQHKIMNTMAVHKNFIFVLLLNTISMSYSTMVSTRR